MQATINQFYLQLQAKINIQRMKANLPTTRPHDSNDLHCQVAGLEAALAIAEDVFGPPMIEPGFDAVEILDTD